jgi:hypothetical protein
MAATSLHISRHHSLYGAARHATHGAGERGVGGKKTYDIPQSKRSGSLFMSRRGFKKGFLKFQKEMKV